MSERIARRGRQRQDMKAEHHCTNMASLPGDCSCIAQGACFRCSDTDMAQASRSTAARSHLLHAVLHPCSRLPNAFPAAEGVFGTAVIQGHILEIDCSIFMAACCSRAFNNAAPQLH